MDIQLEKKKGLQKKHIPYVAGGVLFVILLGWIIFGDHASTLKVDARGISIGNVTREQFNDFFRMDGQVQPITVVQLSPEEGGIVQEKVVEEGAQVKKGDIIVRLSNSNLDLQILNAEAELAEKQNFLRNTQVTMEQDKLTNQMEKLQYDMDMNRARRSFNQQEQLYKENLIAKEDYLKAKEDPAFLAEYRGLLTDYVGRESPLYYAKRLSESIGAPVHVVYGRKGKGQLVIDFANFDDLDALIARIAPDAKEEA